MDAEPNSTLEPVEPASRPPAEARPSNRTGGWLGGMLMMSSMTIFSRILGLMRDIAMARLFGLSPVMDGFTIAFRIPNLSRKLFGEGALATSFIPIFARELVSEDRTTAWRLASAVLGWLTVFLSAVVLAGELGLFVWATYGGVSGETLILIELTANMLPYMIFVCLASQVGAILNSLGHFRWPALAPVVLNAVWLMAAWWVAPWFGDTVTQAHVIGVSILVSGALQLLVQWPALRGVGFQFHGSWGQVRAQVGEILTTMLPIVLGLSITQINTFCDSLFAWAFSQPAADPSALMPLPGGPAYPLAAGAVSALYYAERMYQFPLGVFGVALGTAIFPMLARHAVRGEMEQLKADLSLGLRLVLVIGVPASAALMWIAYPVARCLFERGEFTPTDTVRTAWIIAAYGSGVWAYCGLLILQRGCYAIGDRITPLRLGTVSVGCNLALNLMLIWHFAECGLALSTAVCAMLQVAGLLWAIQHRLGVLDWSRLTSCLLRTVLATALMSVAGIGLIEMGTRTGWWSGKLLGLAVPCVGASAVYVLATWWLKLEEFWMLLRRKTQ